MRKSSVGAVPSDAELSRKQSKNRLRHDRSALSRGDKVQQLLMKYQRQGPSTSTPEGYLARQRAMQHQDSKAVKASQEQARRFKMTVRGLNFSRARQSREPASVLWSPTETWNKESESLEGLSPEAQARRKEAQKRRERRVRMDDETEEKVSKTVGGAVEAANLAASAMSQYSSRKMSSVFTKIRRASSSAARHARRASPGPSRRSSPRQQGSQDTVVVNEAEQTSIRAVEQAVGVPYDTENLAVSLPLANAVMPSHPRDKTTENQPSKGAGPDGLHVPIKLQPPKTLHLTDLQRLPTAPRELENVEDVVRPEHGRLSDPETVDSWLMTQAWLKKDGSDVPSLVHAIEIISQMRKTVVGQFGHDPAAVRHLLGENAEQSQLDAADVKTIEQGRALIGKIRKKLSDTMRPYSDLEILIISATNLRDHDTFGKSDPYAEARIGEAGTRWKKKSKLTGDGEKPRTPIRRNTLFPRWNWKILLRGVEKYEHPELHIRVFDRDHLRVDRKLGEVIIPVIGMSGYEQDHKFKGTNPLQPALLRMAWHRRRPKAQISQIQYKITVKTGKKGFAGTDANVYMRIEGAETSTNAFRLRKFFRNDNEAGDECDFTSPILDNVKRPQQIHIWHDGKGAFSSWYVDWVKVEVQGIQYNFPCYAWIRSPYRPISILEGGASLPQSDMSARAVARASSLNRARNLYKFSTTDSPLGDTKGLIPPFLAFDQEVNGVVDYELHDETEVIDMARAGVDIVVNVGLSALLKAVDRYRHIDEWTKFFHIPNFLQSPDDVRVPVNHLEDWKEDLEFGWQRVAGLNPVMIERLNPKIGLLPPDCVVTEADVKGVLPEGTTLAGEIKAGHIFVCDYHSLKGFEGTELEGEMRYSTAPIALFHADAKNGHPLVPIAIQLERPSTLLPMPLVFTPNDSHYDWLAAKIFVQSSDFAVHQFRSHALHCHLAQEPILVAMNRNLSSAHPVWKLLRPHFHGLARINNMARGVIITRKDPSVKNYSGWILGIGAPGSMLYAATQWQTEYSFDRFWFKESLKRRGLYDNEDIGNYPFRDDGLLLFQTIQDYVADVLGHFYHSDSDLLNDFELQNWVSEMVGVGEVKGLEPILSEDMKLAELKHLVHFCTNTIFIASAEHAAVNFSQVDFAGHIMNTPAGVYAPPPQRKGIVDDDYLVSMMPNKKWTSVQVGILSFLSQNSTDKLGQFQERFFHDPKLVAKVEAFRANLNKVEEEIKQRNLSGTRKKEYTYLLPSNIPNSTAI